jgi:hypothetical protein
LVHLLAPFTAIKHFGPLDRSSGRISAVYPILLFTVPFFCTNIPTRQDNDCGPHCHGGHWSEGKPAPTCADISLPTCVHCGRYTTLFYSVVAINGPHLFLVHSVSRKGLHCIGRHRRRSRPGAHLPPPYLQAANLLVRQKGGRPNPKKYLLTHSRRTMAARHREAVQGGAGAGGAGSVAAHA